MYKSHFNINCQHLILCFDSNNNNCIIDSKRGKDGKKKEERKKKQRKKLNLILYLNQLITVFCQIRKS